MFVGAGGYVLRRSRRLTNTSRRYRYELWCNSIGRTELSAAHTDGRDMDGDGLVVSKQSDNIAAFTFADPALDTFSSGHNNTMVNLLTYRAWCGMDGRMRRPEKTANFLCRAARMASSTVAAKGQSLWNGRTIPAATRVIWFSFSFTQALHQREAAFRKLIYRLMLEARKSTIK